MFSFPLFDEKLENHIWFVRWLKKLDSGSLNF